MTIDPETEEMIRLAAELAPAGLIIVNERGIVRLANREIDRLFGYERSELIGCSVEILVPERFRSDHPLRRADFFSDPRSRPMGAGRELYGLRKDGREIPIEIGLNPLRTPSGVYVLGSVVDVSERRAAQAALRESEVRFRLLVERMQGYAIFMLDPEGKVATWNAGAEAITGWRAEEIVGQNTSIFYPDVEREKARPESVLAGAWAKGKHEEESWRTKKDGSHLLADVVITALDDGRGRLRGFLEVWRDVTAQRRFEDRLRQSQKLEAIGTLAGGIAHDFNNILAGIVGYAEMAATAVRDDPILASDVAKILAASERGRKLVQRLLTFGRRRDPSRTVVTLDGVVREALHLLRASLPSTVEIRERLDPETPHVLADETQIHQIVMNLATNAAQAMQERGGVLAVALGSFFADDAFVHMHPGLRPGLCARLSVTDNGVGMPPEVLDRAMEPFYTTKPLGAGSGLGLSVVHGIVQSHGGVIDFKSRVGEGTSIDVYFPAVGDSLEPRLVAPETGAPLPLARRILFVEDEHALAELGKRQLENAGYRVTVYTSSVEALADFRSRPNGFDLLVTDNTMARMTGLVLSQEILRDRPGMPILMVSGIGDVMDPEVLRAKGIRKILPKPHTASQLLSAVRELLGE